MSPRGSAQVFVGAGKPFEARDYPMPEIEPRGLLVRIKLASICGTDLHIWHGKRKAPLPIILGHEAMGVIERKGLQVNADAAGTPVSEGDRITWSYIKTCGNCYYCRILGDTAGCLRRFVYGLFESCDRPPHFNGAFSEYIYLRPGTSFFKIPDQLSDDVVAPSNCALVTMVSVIEKSHLRQNESVVVQGTGPLGLYAIALARENGASRIIALDTDSSRLGQATVFGADTIINVNGLSAEEIIHKTRDLTDGIGADLVVEATGSPQAIPIGLKLPRDGGRYVTIGPIFQGASAEIDLFDLIFRRVTMIGTARNDAKDLLNALRFLVRTRGRYPFDKIVGKKFDLSNVESAFRELEDRRVMRAAVSVG